MKSIRREKGLGKANIRYDMDHAVVRKEGYDLRAEAEYCRLLYPVTPMVHNWGDDFYEMEYLEEPSFIISPWDLSEIKETLRQKVWKMQLPNFEPRDWRLELLRFCQGEGYLVMDLIMELYPLAYEESRCYIHGDPTLANMMFRMPDNNPPTLVLIDPIYPKGKIPFDRCVDLGKMLQSAIGWENMLIGWSLDKRESIQLVLDDEHHLSVKKAWFWCMVHCIRILRYAKGNRKVESWVRANASAIYEALKKQGEGKCSTHLI